MQISKHGIDWKPACGNRSTATAHVTIKQVNHWCYQCLSKEEELEAILMSKRSHVEVKGHWYFTTLIEIKALKGAEALTEGFKMEMQLTYR